MRIHAPSDAVGGLPHSASTASEALSLMLNALERLDSDPAVPAIIGAQLQHAIDTLCTTYSITIAPDFH